MAAVESTEEIASVKDQEMEESFAHSEVLPNSEHSDTTDRQELTKAPRRRRVRKWKGNKRTPGTSKAFLNPALPVGSTVHGSIEAKIDSAYLISVVVGGEKLKGVLYHVSPVCKVKQFARVVEFQAGDIETKNGTFLRSKRTKFLTKDPHAPKKNRTGYSFFSAEERIRLMETYPEMRTEREIGQTIAATWNRLSQEEKEPYQELGVKDKERYRNEMREYVYQRLLTVRALHEDTRADGDVALEEDDPTELALNILSLEEPQADSCVPIEENGSNPLTVDTSLEKLEPMAVSST